MKFKRQRRDTLAVNLTPLIDVVFLLLIFFMVSTTFIRETQLKINLPQASGELQEVEQGAIEITVDRAGEYAVNDRLLVNSDKRTLMRAIDEVRDPAVASPRVIITADASATHQAVVRAMDAVGAVGLSRVSITTQEPEEE